MKTQEIIDKLIEYNEWRRGGDGPLMEPKLLGQVIEAACEQLKGFEGILKSM